MTNTAEIKAGKSFYSKLIDSIKSLSPETEAQRKQRGQEVYSLAHKLLSLPNVVFRKQEIEYYKDKATEVVYTTSTIFLKPEENKFGINTITFSTPTDIKLCPRVRFGGDKTSWEILDENSKTERLSQELIHIYMFYKDGSSVHNLQLQAVNRDGINDKYYDSPQQRKEFYDTFVPLAKQLLAKQSTI